MSAIKMDELLVSWLGSDDVYENVMDLIQNYRDSTSDAVEDEKKEDGNKGGTTTKDDGGGGDETATTTSTTPSTEGAATARPRAGSGVIPPFYPVKVAGRVRRRRQVRVSQKDTWDPLPESEATAAAASKSAKATSSSAGAATSPTAAAANTANNNNAPPLLPELGAPPPPTDGTNPENNNNNNPDQQKAADNNEEEEVTICVRDQTTAIYSELGQDPPLASPTSDDEDDVAQKSMAQKYLTSESFVRVTKDVCGFPSFFNIPLYARILYLWNTSALQGGGGSSGGNDFLPMEVITFEMFEWFWKTEMEPYDPCDRFFRLVKQVDGDAIVRDDFLPFIKALLQDHPGLEFLSSHAEFQEKYAVTVITRIFYCVNRCHSGRITARQVRRSDLLEAFQQVDEEEDINKVTRYFSYEHFYVLYCRFWELDHDRDYRITREDLLKYGDQSLSHMIVDRIFDAAPRPFEQQLQQQQHNNNNNAAGDGDNPAAPPGGGDLSRPNHRDYLSYEDFIYFMLSEEDKSNEVSVRYWFTCVDVDGDGKLNNMEMRSFYAVQLHRMQFMGHEIVPFEDMLCQMMDMIKPANTEFLVTADFLQPECRPVSGALFDALFNLNKYLLFEQRDPFVERQKREDEFDCDWDRFACLDYSRLAMEEEAREEEAMEIDWVTVDDEEEEGDDEDEDDDDDDEEEEDLTSATEDDDSESDLQGAAMLSGGGLATSSEAPF